MAIHSNLWASALLATALLAGITGAAHAQTFRLGHHHAVGGAVDQAATKFAELVNEKSDGRITIRLFPGAQLGQEREAYDLVNQGAVDISITSTGILDRVYAPMSVTSLPYVFRDWAHATASFNGAFGTALIDGVRENSETEILGFFSLGFRDMLFTGEPVVQLAGMQGLRLRSPENFVWIRMFELLGAQPTPVTWGEVYTAMQTGVAQGLDSPPATALDNHFEEVTKSLVRTQHMFGSMLFAMNEGRFSSLPSEDQAILKAAGQEAGLWVDSEVNLPAELAAYERLEAAGIIVADPENPEEWRAAMTPLLDEIRARNDGSGELIDMLLAE